MELDCTSGSQESALEHSLASRLGLFSFPQPAIPSPFLCPNGPLCLRSPLPTHTSLIVAEGPTQGAAQPHFSILQVFQHEVLHRDGLPVQLVAELFIVSDSSSDHKHFLKQENMEFLEEKSPWDCPERQSSKWWICGPLCKRSPGTGFIVEYECVRTSDSRKAEVGRREAFPDTYIHCLNTASSFGTHWSRLSTVNCNQSPTDITAHNLSIHIQPPARLREK